MGNIACHFLPTCSGPRHGDPIRRFVSTLRQDDGWYAAQQGLERRRATQSRLQLLPTTLPVTIDGRLRPFNVDNQGPQFVEEACQRLLFMYGRGPKR
ncbi:hypothetical protein [Actinopolymorpha pittospori]|uniref:Uncharacterized protein n=1 Tax=Actinopolymorpha pittospori TaxID=648752 RepID=A0A927MPW5_9ACTN|nr:hypothetical protein [Actinopolymorpha pittospori]MBE1604196.1 hypothetical protein [Actinopolymorpha pittospori]